MILRLYWRFLGESQDVRVRVFIAHQPHEDGRFCGELQMHARELVRLQQLDFQSEFHDEVAEAGNG